jgi:hypothetical protein
MQRIVLMPVVVLVVSGCSISAGAGVGAQLGGRPGMPGSACQGFESCDAAYQDALANAERCHEDGGDCEDEDRNLNATYAELRDQTQMEIAGLRREAAEREAALAAAEQAAEAAASDKDCSCPVPAPEQAQATEHRGNSWFDSD